MKTFFGFTTGLLAGTFIGIFMTCGVYLTDDLGREILEKRAEELKNE